MTQISSPTYQVYGVANSMQGGRPENQDDFGFLETPLGFAVVICDGMGGGPGGKTASYIAKYEFLTTLSQCNEQMPPATALKMAVSRAHDALEEKMAQVPELRGMGSTLVGILINKQSAHIVHLGDSRCYQLRGKKVKFRTQDHSLVGELVRSKALTEEQARVSPQSNVITRGLGNTSNHAPDISEVPYKRGDCFVLCTDGVWGVMPHGDLLLRLTAMQDVSTKVANMSAEIDRIGFAKGGHHDNHTLAIIETNTDSILKESMSKQVKIILAVLSALLVISIVFNIICLIQLNKKGGAQTNIDNTVTSGAVLADNNIPAGSQDVTVVTTDEEPTQESVSDTTTKKKVVSITEENEALKRKIEEAKAQQEKEKKDSTPEKSGGKDAQVSGPMQILTQIENNLNTIKNIDEAELKVAAQKSESNTKKTKTLLQTLDEKTQKKYSRIIGGIIKMLESKEFNANSNITSFHDKRGKTRFGVSPITKKRITQDIQPQIDKIKKNLK